MKIGIGKIIVLVISLGIYSLGIGTMVWTLLEMKPGKKETNQKKKIRKIITKWRKEIMKKLKMYLLIMICVCVMSGCAPHGCETPIDDGVVDDEVEITDVSNIMGLDTDSVYEDAETVALIRESKAYKDTMKSLGGFAKYGTRCDNSYRTENIYDGIHFSFGIKNTNVHFWVTLYPTGQEDTFDDIGIDSDNISEYYIDELHVYAIADQPSNTYNSEASWIRFDNDVPLRVNTVYKAIKIAGINGTFWTDYEEHKSKTVDLYDIDTDELLYRIKYEK